MIRSVCIIGVLEYRYQSCDSGLSSNVVVNQNTLDYFNVKKYFRTYKKTHTSNIGILKSVQYYLSAINNNMIKKTNCSKYGDVELLYGIEIDCIGVGNGCKDSIFEKELAEYNMSNFLKFMYDHRGVEFDSQTELMALEINDVDTGENVFEEDSVIMPEDLYDIECNIEIRLVRVENIMSSNVSFSSSVICDLSREINKEFCLYIAKAGFKLNTNSILDPGEDPGFENCRLRFNIYTCKKIKPWIHAMKRKIKKKFHVIEKLEYTMSNMFGSDIENWSITNSTESLL